MKIAHINDIGEEQSVQEHLLGTAEWAKKFADEFGCGDVGYLCGLVHDIGKYSNAFQRRICDPEHSRKVDHSTAGAKELCKRSGEYISLAMAVAGHHSGLLDGGNRTASEVQDGTFFGRLKKEIPTYEEWKDEISFDDIELPEFCTEGTNPSFTLSFFIRMIYSCLVDADYLDTERFMLSDRIVRGRYSACTELLQRFEKYIDGWIHREQYDNGEQEKICRRRTEILLNCMDKGKSFERGIYTLTVPTGGGKTTGSLGFALEHIAAHGMKRVIYVIPYMSIIEQTASVFRDILGDENVLEHHSGILYEMGEEQGKERDYEKVLATENWDKPVIVTTAVQFFESLYACKSSKCRKIHNIANSVVIFDEAQTLPVFYLEPCVAAMSELVLHYRSTVVLCTATQPALEEVFLKYSDKLAIREISSDVKEMYQWFRRTRIDHIGKVDRDTLCEMIAASEQVLCIVNHRRLAQEIYETIEEDGAYCLSTLIYPAARRKKLLEVKERLEGGLPCRVIATSLIEAGVDVDFPRVFRQETGLDSIIQAAGRCNREGKRPTEDSIVSVFELEDSRNSFLAQNIAAFRLMQTQFEDLGDVRAISEYFCLYRDLLGKENLDSEDIMRAFARGIDGNVFPFKTVSSRFHLINNETIPIYIPEGEGETLIHQLDSGQYDRDIFRRLGQYCVNVYPDHLKALLDGGSLRLLESGDHVLFDTEKYREDTGLQMDIETGNGIFF